MTEISAETSIKLTPATSLQGQPSGSLLFSASVWNVKGYHSSLCWCNHKTSKKNIYLQTIYIPSFSQMLFSALSKHKHKVTFFIETFLKHDLNILFIIPSCFGLMINPLFYLNINYRAFKFITFFLINTGIYNIYPHLKPNLILLKKYKM